MSEKTDKLAAHNCRAILRQCTRIDGTVDQQIFFDEMDMRSVAAYGHRCSAKQLALLARIVAVYESEVQS